MNRRRRKLLWQLYPAYLALIVASQAMALHYMSGELRRTVYAAQEKHLQERALAVTHELKAVDTTSAAAIDSLSKLDGRLSGARITIIAPDGTVLGDSDYDPAKMENHLYREEVRGALDGEMSTAVRTSKTLDKQLLYLAIPYRIGSDVAFVVRTATPLASVENELQRINRTATLTMIVFSIVAAVVTFLLIKRATDAIDDLKRGAVRFASGDLSTRLNIPSARELAELAKALNQMAGSLDERISTIERQRTELTAVLSSMVEGVIALNAEGAITSINESACRLFETSEYAAIGRPVQEIVRNYDFQNFVDGAIVGGGAMEGDMTLSGKTDRVFKLYGAARKGAPSGNGGAVIVIHDITDLVKLERVRRDFVSNVSHELRTPLTSIKGYVETLEDGAIDDRAVAVQFLGVIHKQADRLLSIIEDLLELARIEQASERHGVDLTDQPLAPMLARVVASFKAVADAAGVSMNLECADDLFLRVNAELLEVAVSNLVDNALKYMGKGGAIEIKAQAAESSAVISVKDDGIGIAPLHHERIFERFYRVDKSRSREAGGTGLGLSIVKHIAILHGGEVGVDSESGKGSVFFIRLPRIAPESSTQTSPSKPANDDAESASGML